MPIYLYNIYKALQDRLSVSTCRVRSEKECKRNICTQASWRSQLKVQSLEFTTESSVSSYQKPKLEDEKSAPEAWM